jgi:hypothetical protein
MTYRAYTIPNLYKLMQKNRWIDNALDGDYVHVVHINVKYRQKKN